MQIIYDFDGVLFDSYDSVRKMMYPDLARLCGKELTQDELNYCFEHGMADNIENIFGNDAWEFVKSLPYKEYYDHAIPMPFIKPTILFLKLKGINVSICSNRVSGIGYILDRHKMTRYFDNVVTSKEYQSKPNPEGLLSLIDGETWYVGDSETDSLTAHKANVGFIAYNNPDIEADYHISNHLQILSLTFIKGYGIKIAGGIDGNS